MCDLYWRLILESSLENLQSDGHAKIANTQIAPIHRFLDENPILFQLSTSFDLVEHILSCRAHFVLPSSAIEYHRTIKAIAVGKYQCLANGVLHLINPIKVHVKNAI